MNRTIGHPDSDGFSWFSKDADGVFFSVRKSAQSEIAPK